MFLRQKSIGVPWSSLSHSYRVVVFLGGSLKDGDSDSHYPPTNINEEMNQCTEQQKVIGREKVIRIIKVRSFYFKWGLPITSQQVGYSAI